MRFVSGVCALAFLTALMVAPAVSTAQDRTALQAQSWTFRVLHRFGGGDGLGPSGGLVALDGSLYGVTSYGGSGSCKYYPGCGEVFAITTSDQERVVHTFTGGADGWEPAGALLAYKGKLYGTTTRGGIGCECGTVYELSPSGVKRTLYRFRGGTDAFSPAGALVALNGVFYGTAAGGPSGSGTVYAVTPSGAERVVYAFRCDPQRTFVCADALGVNAGLVVLNGKLYGTSTYGGSSGFGTVFELDTAGHERVIHDFYYNPRKPASPGGNMPSAPLAVVNGTLVGTTCYGGVPFPYAFGTIFQMSASGAERVLHSFVSTDWGAACPSAAPLQLAGALVGATQFGGTQGNGSLFELLGSGKVDILHNFVCDPIGPCPDYVSPEGPLAIRNGAFYGATMASGVIGGDGGTVFELSPPAQ